MADFAVRLITPPIHAPSHQLLMDLIKVSAKCRCVLLVLEVPYIILILRCVVSTIHFVLECAPLILI